MRAFGIAGLALTLSLAAQDMTGLDKEVTGFRLSNGFHFTVAERHGAPVVAFNMFVNGGSINDPAGENGMAELLARVAFKGTETIGSKNWPAEKAALQHVEELYDQFEAARGRLAANSTDAESLNMNLKAAIEAAEALGQPDDWKAAIAANGGTNWSAVASYSRIEYRYSLPSNRAEAWFQLESQHFLHPVFREFYKEREAMLTDAKAAEANPQAKIFEDFTAAAFEIHPYRNPVSGWSSTVAAVRLRDAKAFYEKYYSPANVEFTIVGDIAPAEARRLAEKYFGAIPARMAPESVHTGDPVQAGPKTLMMASNLPLVLVGYKRPSQYDKDDLVFDVLSVVLASGKAGVLYRDLVDDKRLAARVEVAPTYPEGRFPCLFVIMMQPVPGHSADELVNALEAAFRRLAATEVDGPDLTRAKSKVRSGVMEQLETNEGIASILPRYVADFNDWKRLETAVDLLNKVTLSDLQRVASRYFTAPNRTMAVSGMPTVAAGAAGGAGK